MGSAMGTETTRKQEVTVQIFAAVLGAVVIRDGAAKGTPAGDLVKTAVEITREAVAALGQYF